MKQTIAVVILVFGILVLVGCTTNTQPALVNNVVAQTTGEVKEMSIDAWSWGFTPEPVTINKGDRVRLKVTSSQGTHGVTIPALGVSTGPVSQGQEEIIEFTATESGTFEYFCNVPCGQGHRGMRGQLVVKE
ncbi:hypothetical protein GOV09_02930 [Candidatus Woesearchaeota archaeon]|nr:hypothetical protein [Candidatus Woesearchaeota archaeon]